MKSFKYSAIRFKQNIDSSWVVSFTANAQEISNWAGIPQKKQFDKVESSGFQREVKKERMDSLVTFFTNPKNVIQNPLLCASRNSLIEGEQPKVTFVDDKEQTDEYVRKGYIHIEVDDYSRFSLKELLELFKSTLESRIPELMEAEVNQVLLDSMKENFFDGNRSETMEDSLDISSQIELEESHIADLWQELTCRILILEEDTESKEHKSILGFDRESIISYLLPVTLVDGQHRLIGAKEHFKFFCESPVGMKETESLIESGLDTEQVNSALEDKFCRKLPISLVLDDDPAEHVFQFVVVNQKATPINNALLGTIVSTTLSNNELERVSQRLKNADIPLEDSKAVSFATRNEDSPFKNLVQTGIQGEDSGKLPWTVMKSLVSIFKDLRGAKFYSDSIKTDFADLWKRRFLIKSELITGQTIEEKLEFWAGEDGFWKEMFIKFWCKIRDEFGNTEDSAKDNYWGNTKSNLFNKVSLTILVSDYFKYLTSARVKFDTLEDLDSSFDDWLDGVSRGYFDRPWHLSGIKKDTPGIRKQWSNEWMNYREDPNKLPNVSNFRKSFGS
ncbi:hypothetical protein [Vibrio neptunius]|uniref:DGQHR domain-containing protein n=1 Tax=Vibrio neptunius TaxID=170651 RepID=A0ABS2ZY87_9VIBR|nr:hypothetical protein [Vibrio neptunius]MBN3492222.1 hypothetical protein [Vibrio neptunius]MBN3514719.1 hypothetical protein [Vibrio neptunius]MBN3552126.1 hypothetical protein [Vibrio neptunius]MBN3576680.1 hypothetical protein [Vibrio neptunius]MCH9870344.1 hypothetical protein [Vibrio neptunius]